MLRPVDRFLVLQRQIHYGNDVVAKVWVNPGVYGIPSLLQNGLQC